MRNKTIQRILDETPKEVEIFVNKYAALVQRINQLLQEREVSQKQLAERLGKQPSEVSKWLNGSHNLTLRSIAKLEAELGEPLLVVPGSKETNMTADGYHQTVFTFVRYQKFHAKTEGRLLLWENAEPQKKLNNVG